MSGGAGPVKACDEFTKRWVRSETTDDDDYHQDLTANKLWFESFLCQVCMSTEQPLVFFEVPAFLSSSTKCDGYKFPGDCIIPLAGHLTPLRQPVQRGPKAAGTGSFDPDQE